MNDTGTRAHAKVYHDADVELAPLVAATVAIIGYGSQGRAQALNLRDSGVFVEIGLHDRSVSRACAESDGFRVRSPGEAAARADLVVLLTPDVGQDTLYRTEIGPNMSAAGGRGGHRTLMFAHGFGIRFGEFDPDPSIDVSMVAPKAPGHRVRETFVAGEGVPGLVAVHQDASGHARAVALAYAKAIGCTRAGVIETTFAEEAETDLFGEQAVLCGGVSALVRAAFDTLVEAGYQPEVAYFECMHELKLIVDLMYEGGLTYMRYSISDTAEYGDYIAGERIVTEQTRAAMRELLGGIRSGAFARAWMAENRGDRSGFTAMRDVARRHPIEEVGRRMRRMIPFIDAKEVLPGTGH